MKPRIDRWRFGSITVEGAVFDHDVLIRLDGQVERRQKGLSRDLFGTSHIISPSEAEQVYEEGAKRLIVGAGMFRRVKLSPGAARIFEEKGCQVELLRTSRATRAWNRAEGPVIGLFHVSC
jgi:hypothetical protein